MVVDEGETLFVPPETETLPTPLLMEHEVGLFPVDHWRVEEFPTVILGGFAVRTAVGATTGAVQEMEALVQADLSPVLAFPVRISKVFIPTLLKVCVSD